MERALAWRKKFYYDRKAAFRVCYFFENELQHIEGEHAGSKFLLLAWQKRMLRRIFGWKRRADGTRKHRRVLLFIAKKNGKSAIASGIALYLLMADKEQGSRVVSAAADTEQADLVFSFAKENIARNPKLLKQVGRTFKRSIAVHKTSSSYKVLSSAAETKHGPNLHGVLIDELHALPNRELVDTLVAGIIARKQPLVFYTTTAGHNKNSICGEVYDYACGVRDGTIQDEEFLPIVFEPGKDDDWRERDTWYKANPSLGITIPESSIAADCLRAQELPAEENKFKRLHLNMWTEQETRWLPMDKWKLCGAPFLWLKSDSPREFTESDLIGMDCFGGLDLSSRIDIAALCLLFEPTEDFYYPLFRFWVPTENALERQRKGQAAYHDWIRDGYLIGTKGNDIDYNFIQAQIESDSKIYNIKEIGFDPWNANQLTHNLNDEVGIKMIPMRQGYGTMSSPSKQLEALILSQKFRHGNHPVLNWMASNVCAKTDHAGNILPDKSSNPHLKIDGMVALVMALGRAILQENSTSVYESRGVRTT